MIGRFYDERSSLIKLLAIDLDGTLYNSRHELTEANREAVRALHRAGVQPVIVTGRGRRGAEFALTLLGLELPYICNAGALVRPGKQGDAWYAWDFYYPEEIGQVIAFCRQHPQTGLIAENQEGNPLWFGPDSMQNVMDPLTYKEAFASRRSTNPEADFNQPLLKMTIVAEPPLLQEYEALVRQHCPSVHQIYSGIRYIDLTREGINKGAALAALSDRLGMKANEVAAIGDQEIDLSMLQFSGLAVAMSNAVPALEQAAHLVAPSNDEDGVAWLAKQILEQNKHLQKERCAV